MIGKLKHRVEIQSVSTSTNDHGETIEGDWTTENTVWASIVPAGGKEQVHADQIKGTISHKITIRHLSGLTSDKRIKFGSRIFHIEPPINLNEESRWLEIPAVEAV